MGVSLFLPIADAAPCERPSGFLRFGQAGLSEVGRLGGFFRECKRFGHICTGAFYFGQKGFAPQWFLR
jgi:hypothetical protein